VILLVIQAGKAGEGGAGVSASNRRVKTYQVPVSGLSNFEQPVSLFERMFKGIRLAPNPANS
jgi:hypothetical protein